MDRCFLRITGGAFFLLSAVAGASATECPGNPNAIGVSRVINFRPSDYPLVGKLQYLETLRLRDREVVLTFDDGPMPPYTGKVLDALAAECVKATFFKLGTNVAEAPDLVRRTFQEGHNVGSHTFTHPDLAKLPLEDAKKEIDLGIQAASEALGNPRDLSPFFRPPFLSMTRPLERYLNSRGIMVWSIDADSFDWNSSSEEKMIETTITALEKVKKGIVLMHDVQPVTARALPTLLAELKRRNFRIVHVKVDPTNARSSNLKK